VLVRHVLRESEANTTAKHTNLDLRNVEADLGALAEAAVKLDRLGGDSPVGRATAAPGQKPCRPGRTVENGLCA
jgi:hypothetical protein